jgi:hypothetical protein
MEITFELIEPLVKKSSFETNKLTCLFRVPNSDRSVEAVVSVYPSQASSSGAMSQIKQETGYTVSYYLRQILQRFLGSQLASSISRVTDQLIRTIATKTSLSKKEKREATVRAFQSVSDQFEYMEGAWRMKG